VRSVVVVGASLAGLSAAQALRSRGFDGKVTIVGDELHMPYQRPPLSKRFLTGEAERGRLDLPMRRPEDFDWQLGTCAQRLDLERHEVETSGRLRLPFDGLIVATGARAKELPGGAQLDGVFTLRTIDDAIAIRRRVVGGARNVVIVGAGFIGCEVAASLRELGCEVTLIDLDRFPMQRVLGEELGAVCLEVHRAHGARLIMGVGFAGFMGASSVQGVHLSDGRTIEAEMVILGVGVTPNVEWLEGSGMALNDGVVCDESCAAIGVNGVVAAGDVARWQHPRFGSMRVEHWDNAIAQGRAAADTLLVGREEAQAFGMIPCFWSDQYDCKLQLIGAARPSDTLRVVEGNVHSRRFVAVFLRQERVVAAFLFNSMHRIVEYKKIVDNGELPFESKSA